MTEKFDFNLLCARCFTQNLLTEKVVIRLFDLDPVSEQKLINYGTKRRKELNNKQTSVERILSRLLSIAMQHPTVRGYHANRNNATVAHIALLLVWLI